ncbi:ubiquitin-activating enzyme E1 [Theileria orientalis]|uniref:E1 ubiquitin-activating enzyme n=1 Tax=Theileria orientalis TaxID=68886 RepID=A0A976QSL7_THEOR|nr:ubiquitin-activating enzyme E1 [Theileria orientalis]
METTNRLGNADKIDTNLYSRQIGTFGFEMMGKLQRLKVLIIGMKASGIEIAKNLALMGVESISIHDNNLVQKRDLGVNYFIRSSSVGKETVSAACLSHLRDLNRNVIVQNVIQEPNEELVVNHDVVVCCDQNVELIKRLNDICRNNSSRKRVGFICCDTFGMIGSVFVDFGNNFVCLDTTGRELKTAIIESISNDKDGLVTVITDKVIDFQTGDYVRFSEIEGMVELNNKEPLQINVNSKSSFTIGDTSKYSQYISGGVVTEVKIPKRIDFRSFEDCVLDPSKTGSLATIDYSLFGRAEQLHWVTMAYRMSSNGDDVWERAEFLNKNSKSCSQETIDKKVYDSFMSQRNYKVPPLASFIGAVGAHEVIKFTGKYHPIEQWLYVDFSLPSEMLSGDFSGNGFDERYMDQVSLWGSEVQNRILNSKIFVVGAGALGCEFLKNFALLGCSSQGDGLLTITDNDRIEVSNISRQFLFRSRHVGMSKSMVACKSALDINPNLRVKPLEIRVGEETENLFDENFWSSQTLIVNALDNIQARTYVDGRCVWYEKPLLESGTLGTLGNVQVILPHITQCYSETQDPPETAIPLCTLKHFPYAQEHVVEWARDAFVGIFTQIPLDIKKILNRQDLNELTSERLELILSVLKAMGSNTKHELLKISAELFNNFFVNEIRQLLHSFPPDHLMSDGQKFWSPPKRCPTPLKFDTRDEMVQLFLVSTAKILASMMNLNIEIMEEDVLSLSKLHLKEFRARTLKLSQDKLNVEVTTILTNDLGNSPVRVNSGGVLETIEFEKDDETNFHVEFVWAASVLRSRNYGIKECDKMKAKLISGKIIPAIATTTAMIGGLVTIEFLKTLFYKSLKIENFRNAFACLATPIWLQSEPLPPTPTKDKEYDPVTCGPVRALPKDFTIWNKLLVMIPNGTVKQLIDWIRSKFNIEVIILSAGNLCIYNSFLPQHRNERLTQPITQLVEKLGKKPIPPNLSHLVIDASCTDPDDIDVVIPSIKFEFR